MNHRIFVITLILHGLLNISISAKTRIKNLVNIKGVRDNSLIGYGLVIGLNGTGDGGGEITDSSLRRMFQKLGLNPQKELSAKNVAAVVVTTKMSSYARTGQKLDVVVSSIGQASSLSGGTLLITPLKGGDGEIYAVADGHVSVGGTKAGEKFATTGRIVGGAVVEKELKLDFSRKKALRLSLKRPDFTTNYRITKTINDSLGGKFATSKDISTIDLIVPSHYHRKTVELISLIENFKVYTDQAAKIVINERTGTIVAGGEVTLGAVAIGHGNLTVEVKAQGEDGGGGNASQNALLEIDKKVTLKDLVKALNALGTSPDDLVSIFQALKSGGSLVGEIEFI